MACLGGGLLVLLLSGLYSLLKELVSMDVNPVVFLGGAGVVVGVIILLVSAAADRTNNGTENISKEDLQP